MGTRERPRDRGRRLGFKAVASIAEELRIARVVSGTSRRELGAAAGVSRTTEAHYESGRFDAATIVGAAELLAVAGLGLAISTYPLGDLPRDRRHADLAAALVSHVRLPLLWRTEVPLPNAGDIRGWDVLIHGRSKRSGTEIVRVLGDIQALSRRIALKRRDGGVDFLLVAIADTPANRRILAAAPTFLPELPRLKTLDVIAALEAGNHPGDGIFFFRPEPKPRSRRD